MNDPVSVTKSFETRSIGGMIVAITVAGLVPEATAASMRSGVLSLLARALNENW